MDGQQHALYERTMAEALASIDRDQTERDAQRREEMRRPIEPKPAPVIMVRETVLPMRRYVDDNPGDAKIAGDGQSPPESVSAPSSSSGSSSASSSSSSVPSSSSSIPSAPSSSSSSVPSSSSAPSSSASVPSSASSSSLMSFPSSHDESVSIPAGCTVTIDAIVSDCIGGVQTVTVAMTGSATGVGDCSSGDGIITINGVSHSFHGKTFVVAEDVPCPSDDTITGEVSWDSSCDCCAGSTPEHPKTVRVKSADGRIDHEVACPLDVVLTLYRDGTPFDIT